MLQQQTSKSTQDVPDDDIDEQGSHGELDEAPILRIITPSSGRYYVIS
jgi:hypothetical protein